jgi:predicted enzyme related to lactoylglutathione lyase
MKFYHDLLGLSIKKMLDETIVFEQGLVLVPKNYCTKHLEGIPLRAMLYIEVRDIEKQLDLVWESGLEIITSMNQWGKSLRIFRCYDPDGNIVEVFGSETPLKK